MESSALGFSYVRSKPRNGQLAKMRSFHQSKRSDNKQYAVEVRWGIFFENLTYFFIPQSNRKYSHTNSYNSAMTVIAQDDHLTAGAWAACVQCCLIGHKPVKGIMYWRPTLQSHCEGAFWFWPGSTLKTTTESKKSEIIRQFLSKCISTEVNYASYQFLQQQNWPKMCYYQKFVGSTSPFRTENIQFITKW